MTAASAKAARDALLDTLRASAACITPRVLLVARRPTSRQPPFFSFVPVNTPVPLRSQGRHGDLLLSVSIEYSVSEVSRRAFVATVTAYIYSVLTSNGTEIVTYHWHPTGTSRVRHPHLHIPGVAPVVVGAHGRAIALADAHLVTNYVRFRGIVRMLIEEFGVQPLRDNWREVLLTGETQPLPE